MGIPRVINDGVEKILYVHKYSSLRIIQDPIIATTRPVPVLASNNPLSTIYSTVSISALCGKRNYIDINVTQVKH